MKNAEGQRATFLRQPAFLALAAVAVIYLATFALVEKKGFWIVDNANKYLQVQSLVGSRFNDTSIPWPGREVDPGYLYNPLPAPFSTVRDGKLFSQYSLPFALLSAAFFAMIGWPGLYLLPLAAALLLAAGVHRLARLVSPDRNARWAAVLVASLMTPLWFYGQVFWEHEVAACLGVWGLVGLLESLRRPRAASLLAGSALLGASVWFRDELYLFCLVAVAAVVLHSSRDRARRLAGACAGLAAVWVPLWLLQWRTLGDPFGLHLETTLAVNRGVATWIAERPQAFYNLFLASGTSVSLSLVLAAPFVVAALWRPRWADGRSALAVPLFSLAAAASGLAVLTGYALAVSPPLWMLATNSLFPAAPILVLAFIRTESPESGSEPRPRLLVGIALAYALLYALLTPLDRTQGIHWGNRLLLILYPVLAVPAGICLARWLALAGKRLNWKTMAVALLVVVSLGAQIYSLVLLDRRQSFSRRLNGALRERLERVVITDTWWVPQEMFGDFFNRQYFVAFTSAEQAALLTELSKRGVERVLFATQEPLPGYKPVVSVGDAGMNTFTLRFYSLRVPGSGSR